LADWQAEPEPTRSWPDDGEMEDDEVATATTPLQPQQVGIAILFNHLRAVDPRSQPHLAQRSGPDCWSLREDRRCVRQSIPSITSNDGGMRGTHCNRIGVRTANFENPSFLSYFYLLFPLLLVLASISPFELAASSSSSSAAIAEKSLVSLPTAHDETTITSQSVREVFIPAQAPGPGMTSGQAGTLPRLQRLPLFRQNAGQGPMTPFYWRRSMPHRWSGSHLVRFRNLKQRGAPPGCNPAISKRKFHLSS